jgi:hypothetical protein
MKNLNLVSRRTAVKSSLFGLMAVSLPNIVFAKNIIPASQSEHEGEKLFYRFPAIDDKIVADVVGSSHFNLDKVKELVNKRPELARATWDWGFGDWETALGAASHVARRDIAGFLMSKGARPDIFTYAMMGAYEAVKAMIDASPGIQTIGGPHGISLLQHAKNGLRAEGLTPKQKEDGKKTVDYLESVGNADVQEKYIDLDEPGKAKYLGDYKYGDGPEDGFTIQLNMRKNISLGKLGKSGGALYQKKENVFIYNGTSSVEITFTLKEGKVMSLTVNEPGLTLTAVKI